VTDTQTFVSRRERRRQAKPSIARAVANNAGTVGRGAAVAMATSGLVITSGAAANAAADDSQGREVTTLQVAQSDLSVERASSSSNVAVTASKGAELTFDRPVVSSTPAPEPEPEPAPQPTTQEEAPVQEAPAQQEAPVQEAPAQEAPAQQAEQTQQDSAQQEQQSEPAAETESQPEPASAPAGGGSIVSAAYAGVGTPYSWGGTTTAGFDCSGFINWAYNQAGKSLPRTTYGMASSLTSVSSPEPGDIVLAEDDTHGGIYVGNGQVISATPSGGVRLHGLHESWHNPSGYYRA